MSGGRLNGQGILVTRPAHHADKLVSAIERQGGSAIRFAAIEIRPRDAAAIRRDLDSLLPADIVIFVSSTAVAHGFRPEFVGAGQVAAIGPTTQAEIVEAGGTVDIVPVTGFDSEHLLLEPALQDVAGRCVRIIRGNGGRELLADTLRARGARVEYLAVYERRPEHYSEPQLRELTDRWQTGQITRVVIMSVETLTNLLEILPPAGLELLRKTPLVTPSKRVIQKASELLPGVPTTLSAGPQTGDMIRALSSDPDQRLRKNGPEVPR